MVLSFVCFGAPLLFAFAVNPRSANVSQTQIAALEGRAASFVNRASQFNWSGVTQGERRHWPQLLLDAKPLADGTPDFSSLKFSPRFPVAQMIKSAALSGWLGTEQRVHEVCRFALRVGNRLAVDLHRHADVAVNEDLPKFLRLNPLSER